MHDLYPNKMISRFTREFYRSMHAHVVELQDFVNNLGKGCHVYPVLWRSFGKAFLKVVKVM